MAVTLANALVLEADDIAAMEVVDRVFRHIGVDHQLAAIPIRHAVKDRGDILQHDVRLLLGLQIQIAGETRLQPALAIGHHLVAPLGDAVQRVAIDHGRSDALTQPVVRMQHQVIFVSPPLSQGLSADEYP